MRLEYAEVQDTLETLQHRPSIAIGIHNVERDQVG